MTDFELYLEECLPILARMRDGSVQAVVTDPPDHIAINHPEYFEHCMRVSGGHVIWIAAAKTLRYVSRYDPPPENIIAWIPPIEEYFTGAVEFKYHPIACWGLNEDAETSTIRDEIIYHPWDHPGTKPVSLMKKLIQMLDVDGVILDPFMGSGSTGAACKELGIDFMGIESNLGYFEIAEKRLRNDRRISD
jgi:DNA modification methylase